jgi:hypothetical protein
MMLVSDVNSWCDRPDDAQTWRGFPYGREWGRRSVRDITRVISQTPEQLILECRPSDVAKTTRRTIFWWLRGGIFVWLTIAVCIYLVCDFCFPNPGKPLITTDELIFPMVLAILNGLLIGTSLFALVNAKVSTFILDKVVGELTIITRSMRQAETMTYSLRQCQGAIVEAQAVTPEAAPRYMYYKCWIVLYLSGEQSIRLTATKRLPKVPTEKNLADTINEFLGVQPSIEG